MGRVKEWAMEHQECGVCGVLFIPMDAMADGHEIDLGFPTCSQKCWSEYCQVMNAIADDKEI